MLPFSAWYTAHCSTINCNPRHIKQLGKQCFYRACLYGWAWPISCCLDSWCMGQITMMGEDSKSRSLFWRKKVRTPLRQGVTYRIRWIHAIIGLPLGCPGVKLKLNFKRNSDLQIDTLLSPKKGMPITSSFLNISFPTSHLCIRPFGLLSWRLMAARGVEKMCSRRVPDRGTISAPLLT
jgi:hypothetical protein